MPPQLPSTSSLPAWLGPLHPVDLVILAALLIYGVGGLRRGFVSSAMSVVGLFVTVGAAIVATAPVSTLIRGVLPGLPLPDIVIRALAFVAALAVAQVLFSIVSRFILGAVDPVRRMLGPLALIERLLGFIPGVLMGLIIVALVITPLRLFSFSRAISDALDESVLAREITRRVSDWSPQFETLLQNVSDSGVSLPSRIIQPDENVQVPRTSDVQPDPDSEVRMLELLNGERVKAGLRPLVADERLRQVARQHSQEMFRLGYFAHISPSDGSPADRLQRSGILFITAGENLAYAPTVDIAHAGLMASPGHRQNILTPEFTRIGIGVMRGGLYGRMFTQNFAG